MTNDSDDIDRIDRERRRREAELLVLLLLFGRQARRQVVNAIRLGSDPLDALRLAWLGSEHFIGVVTPLANAMADAHAAGYRRTGRLVGGGIIDATKVIRQPGIYRPAAQNAATLASDTLSRRLSSALALANAPDARIAAVRQAFTDGGWDKSSPRILRLLSETVIVQAYGAGMFAAGLGLPTVRGFRHRSVLDAGTTEICIQRDGLTLPKDDLYWLRGFPPLHPRCRSLLMPVVGEAAWSDVYPTEPPYPGFGYPPIGFNAGSGIAA